MYQQITTLRCKGACAFQEKGHSAYHPNSIHSFVENMEIHPRMKSSKHVFFGLMRHMVQDIVGIGKGQHTFPIIHKTIGN